MNKSPDDIQDRLIKVFIRLRKENGLSHETLAQSAGLHRSTVSLIESGKRSPTLKTCLRIAHVFEKDLSALLAESE